MLAQPLRRDVKGRTYVHLADDVIEAENLEDLREEYLDARKPENVGFVVMHPKRYTFGEEILVGSDEF